MPEVRVRVTPEELADLDERARFLKVKRSEYVRQLLFADTRPMDERELHGLVAAKARMGNMRAIEILARTTSVPPAGSVDEDANPFAEVIEIAGRG